MSKPLLLLVDGYNVIGPIAAPARGSPSVRWLQSERAVLLRRLVEGFPDSVLKRTCVVFDAANPPPDRPSSFQHHGIQVRFAVDYPEADDLLEELIAAHHSAKQLSVVTSDRRVQVAAERRGANWFDSQSWLDGLLDGRARLAHWPRGTADNQNPVDGTTDSPLGKPDSTKLGPEDVRQWLDEFGLDP